MKQAYPLTWPDHWKRTGYGNRRPNGSWKGGTDRYRRHLWDELRMLGVPEVIISTNKPLRIDGQFRIDTAEPSDPGVAVYFKYKGKDMCFACDKFTRVEWNLHAIGLTIAAIRTIERCGASDMMERAFRGFTAIPENAGQFWRDVFGFGSDRKVTMDDVNDAFRERAKQHHPDIGGDPEEFRKIVNARDNARRDLVRAV